MTSDLLSQIRAERASGKTFTLRDWLTDNPLPDTAFTQTIAGVAHRVLAGDKFFTAVRELLDELNVVTRQAQLDKAIADSPERTGDRRHDAYLAALGEHLAGLNGTQRPDWVIDPERFLDRFWFVSAVPGFRALAIAESPAAFRRRGIFVSRGSLERC